MFLEFFVDIENVVESKPLSPQNDGRGNIGC